MNPHATCRTYTAYTSAPGSSNYARVLPFGWFKQTLAQLEDLDLRISTGRLNVDMHPLRGTFRFSLTGPGLLQCFVHELPQKQFGLGNSRAESISGPGSLGFHWSSDKMKLWLMLRSLSNGSPVVSCPVHPFFQFPVSVLF